MKRTTKIIILLGFLFGASLVFTASASNVYNSVMEVKIKGLVCSSCGIGIKRNFKRISYCPYSWQQLQQYYSKI